MSEQDTRAQIVEAADELFYRVGYAQTSFSDIAEAVRISRGNFYYYFKTKDAILDAVIARRLESTREMLARWEAEGGAPAERIRCFIDILIVNRAKIKRYGCPVGTLASELAKLNHEAQGAANKLFTLFRTWLARQFEAAGCREDADSLALHLLARSQGMATLANAYRDEKFIRREVQQMYDWLDAQLPESTKVKPPRRQRAGRRKEEIQ
ncbi:MAG: TetR/AcrR family transcriptional regulator [Kiloniellaceae bacterium]